MNINELKQAAQAALNQHYSGDNKLELENAYRLIKDFHRMANPGAVLALIEEVEKHTKWVCASAPPDPDTDVLIMNYHEMTIGFINDGEWFDGRGIPLTDGAVSLWMPLPARPKFKE